MPIHFQIRDGRISTDLGASPGVSVPGGGSGPPSSIPRVQFQSPGSNGTQGDIVQIVVSADAPFGAGAHIPVLFGGSAVRGVDYERVTSGGCVLQGSVLRPSPGSTSQIIYIRILTPVAKQLQLELVPEIGNVPLQGAVIGFQRTHVLSIQDVTHGDPPVFSWEVEQVTILEGVGTYTAVGRLSYAPIAQVIVNLVGGGSNSATIDTQQLIFGTSDTQKQVTITWTDDSDPESGEFAVIRALSIQGPATLPPESTVSIAFTDDDAPMDSLIRWETASVSASESDQVAFVKLLAEPSPTAPVTVGLGVTGPNGPSLNPSSVTFATGDSEKLIRVQWSDDSVEDSGEQLLVAINSITGPGQVASQSVIAVNIVDDDGSGGLPVVAFTEVSGTVTEGDTSRLFDLTRTGSTDQTLLVNFIVTGSAQPVEYDIDWPGGTIFVARFQQGESVVQIGVSADLDGVTEGPETILLTAQPSADYVVALNQGQLAVTIADFLEPEIRFQDQSSQAVEGVPGGTTIRLLASDGNHPDLTIPIDLSGSADASDYIITWPGGNPGSVFMPQGATTADILVQTLEDPVEGTETVVFEIEAGAGYTLGSTLFHTHAILEEPIDGTLVQWERDTVIPSNVDVPISFVVPIDPVPAASIPRFYFNNEEADVFPLTYLSINDNGFVDSVKVVANQINSGQSSFTDSSSNPVTPGFEFFSVGLEFAGLRATVANSGVWELSLGAMQLVEVKRTGRFIREERFFGRLNGPDPDQLGPGVTLFTERVRGAVICTLMVQNQCYEPNNSTLFATDADVTGQWNFLDLELFHNSNSTEVVEGEVVDNSQDFERIVNGRYNPYLVKPEQDPSQPLLPGTHVLPAGLQIVRHFVFYSQSVWNRDEARELGRMAGKATAVAGDYAIQSRPFYGGVRADVDDPLTLRRVWQKNSNAQRYDGRAASLAYEQDQLALTQSGITTDFIDQGDTFSTERMGWWRPYGPSYIPGSGGVGINPVYDANWCRSGWRVGAARITYLLHRIAYGIINPVTGEEVQPEDLVAANDGVNFPYDMSIFLQSQSNVERAFLHWQQQWSKAIAIPNSSRVLDETRPWNRAEDVLPGVPGNTLQDDRVFPFKWEDPFSPEDSYLGGDLRHQSRYDGALEALAFGAGLQWAEYLMAQHGTYMRRAGSYQSRNGSGVYAPGFQSQISSPPFIIQDIINKGVQEQAKVNWDRGQGMLFRIVAFEARFVPTSVKKGEITNWANAWANAAALALTPWGAGQSFDKTEPSTLNFPRKPADWGVHDPVNQTGALPDATFPADWVAAQSWMGGYVALGAQALVVAVLGTTSPGATKFDRVTRRFYEAMYRLEPNGARRPGSTGAPSVYIVSNGNGGKNDPALPLPYPWLFTPLNSSLPANLDHRGMVGLTGAWRTALLEGDTVLADEMLGYIKLFFGLPSTATNSQLLDEVYGDPLGNLGINGVRGLERSQRYPYLALAGLLAKNL